MTLEFVRYGVAGGIALFCHLAVLAFFVEELGSGETIASAIGFVCAVPVNYYLQRQFVFRSSAAVARSFALYCAVTIGMLCINTVAFWILVEQAGLYYPKAQIVTTFGVVILNYISNRTVTFAEHRQG